MLYISVHFVLYTSSRSALRGEGLARGRVCAGPCAFAFCLARLARPCARGVARMCLARRLRSGEPAGVLKQVVFDECFTQNTKFPAQRQPHLCRIGALRGLARGGLCAGALRRSYFALRGLARLARRGVCAGPCAADLCSPILRKYIVCFLLFPLFFLDFCCASKEALF